MLDLCKTSMSHRYIWHIVGRSVCCLFLCVCEQVSLLVTTGGILFDRKHINALQHYMVLIHNLYHYFLIKCILNIFEAYEILQVFLILQYTCNLQLLKVDNLKLLMICSFKVSLRGMFFYCSSRHFPTGWHCGQ